MENNNYSPLKALLGTTVAIACLVSVVAQPASARTLTGLTRLSQADLTEASFNWGQAPGQHTLNSQFDKSVLPAEAAEPESVTEPGTIVGLLILGTTFVVRRRDRQASDG